MSSDHDKPRRRSAVDQYAGDRHGRKPEESTPIEQVGPFYGREREVRGPALSLTLKLKNGNAKTLEYAHRVEMDFDPEDGIAMIFSTGIKITIKGRHLQQLFDDLAGHKVVWIESRDTLHAYKQISEVTGKPLPVVLDIIIARGRIDVDSGLWQPAPGNWSTEHQTWVANVNRLN